MIHRVRSVALMTFLKALTNTCYWAPERLDKKVCTYLCESIGRSVDSGVASLYAKGVHFNFLFRATLIQHSGPLLNSAVF